MFTEEQKGVVAKWLKAHGKSKAPKAQFEDYWSLFEKSATRELVGEFNSAAGEGGVQISRTKRAMTKGVEEGIDQVNAQYEDEEASQSESSDDGGWTSVQETKVEAKRGKEEKKKVDIKVMRDIEKVKFSLEPLKTTIKEGGDVQMWFRCFEEEAEFKGVPKKYWGTKLVDLLDTANRVMVDIADYEASKMAIMEVYDDFKTTLRQVYEIEEEPDSTLYSIKQGRAKRFIKNYDSYLAMVNKIKRIQNKEFREELLGQDFKSWEEFTRKCKELKFKYHEGKEYKPVEEIKQKEESAMNEEIEIDALRQRRFRGGEYRGNYGRNERYYRGFSQGPTRRQEFAPRTQQYSQVRRCFCCDSTGHILRDCPLLQKLKKMYETKYSNYLPQGKRMKQALKERCRPMERQRVRYQGGGRRKNIRNNLDKHEYKVHLRNKMNVLGEMRKNNESRCNCIIALPNNIEIKALVDTGSVVNVMNKELWRNIGAPKLVRTKDKFVSVNHEKMRVLGKCVVSAVVKDKRKDCEFYVFDEDIRQPIIGWDGLTTFGGKILLEKGTWEPGGCREICILDRFVSEDVKKKDLENVFRKFHKVFCQRMEKAGQCTAGEGEIELLNDTPVYTAMPPMSQTMKKELHELVKDMLQRGVIEKSRSNYASNAVLVTKRSGKKRVTTSYKKLNEKIRADKFPLPRIDQIVQEFTDVQFFSKIDLTDGYWQIKLRERDRPYTAFHTPEGLYQYRVLPQGLSSSPAIFQRIMSSILEENIGKFVRVYIDDILIFSKSWKEHVKHVEWVLKKLEEAHLVLSKEKCEWGKESIEFLGHRIDKDGVHITEFRTEKMKNYPTPRNAKEVQRAMGLFNYVRRFIPNFSKIALPIIRLERKDVKFQWTEECQKAWDTLKEKISQAPILAFPKAGRPFELHTDASKLGFGCVLIQRDTQGRPHIIACQSKTLNEHESKYSAQELEAACIIWAMKTLKGYIYGEKIVVVTDHYGLTYYNKSGKEKSAKAYRWMNSIEDYDYEIVYRRGITNIADYLSRRFLEQEQKKQIQRIDVEETGAEELEPVGYNKRIIAAVTRLQDKMTIEDKDSWEPRRISAELEKESHIKDVLEYLRDGRRWKDRNKNNQVEKKAKKFRWKNGRLYQVEHFDGFEYDRVVIPKSMRNKALKQIHDSLDGGHFGRKRTWDEMRKTFYWHHMWDDVMEYVDKCPICNAKRTKSGKEGMIQQPALAVRFFQRVGIDLIEMTTTERGNREMIVAVDHHTKYVFTKALKSGSAEEVMDFILNDLYFKHGTMEELWSDNGAVFVGETLDWLNKWGGVKRVLTSSYHPQTNGQTERMNRAMVNILSKYVSKDQGDWDILLPAATWMYNTSINESTGQMPYEMLTGRKPRKTIHSMLMAGHNAENKVEWKNRKQIFEYLNQSAFAKETLEKARQAINYNKGRKDTGIKVGDIVRKRIHNVRAGLKSKLSLPMAGPYKVVARKGPNTFLLKDANRVYDRPVNVADLRKTKEMFVDRQIDFRDEIS